MHLCMRGAAPNCGVTDKAQVTSSRRLNGSTYHRRSIRCRSGLQATIAGGSAAHRCDASGPMSGRIHAIAHPPVPFGIVRQMHAVPHRSRATGPTSARGARWRGHHRNGRAHRQHGAGNPGQRRLRDRPRSSSHGTQKPAFLRRGLSLACRARPLLRRTQHLCSLPGHVSCTYRHSGLHRAGERGPVRRCPACDPQR